MSKGVCSLEETSQSKSGVVINLFSKSKRVRVWLCVGVGGGSSSIQWKQVFQETVCFVIILLSFLQWDSKGNKNIKVLSQRG